MNYTIYTGKSRLTKVWTPETYTWDSFCDKLSKPVITKETQEEYFQMSKAEQGQAKDVGGFVAGELKGGVRKVDTVLNRCFITLDADEPKGDFIKKCETGIASLKYCIYTTHSHTPEKPRFRLIVPINRAVSPLEYEALARFVADLIDINSFDDSTFEACRFMYWSSQSKGAEFRFITNNNQFANFLDADNILDHFGDWRNPANWAYSETAKARKNRNSLLTVAPAAPEPTFPKPEQIRAGFQENPKEKGGIVGVFCRAYGIKEAILNFLSDVYAPTEYPDRFTYTNGSTFGGLKVYDNLFAYSHHGTDPVSERTCNAFDLVRIHKFGNSKESFDRMAEFANSLNVVRDRSITEAFQNVESDNPPAPLSKGVKEGESKIPDWYKKLSLHKKTCKPVETIDNVAIILDNDEKLKDLIWYDSFENKLKLYKQPHWRKSESKLLWTDDDASGLRNYLEKHYGITKKNKIDDGFAVHAMNRTKHPLREYLKALVWDGKPRLETLFCDFLGVSDTDLSRTFSKLWITASVARTLNQSEIGVKFDNILILQGPQGIGKSTMLQKLGQYKYHTDSLETVSGKEAMEEIQGKQIIEIGELSAFRKSEETKIKQFLSKSVDSFRPAYGRYTQDFIRCCVFAGTTNMDTFLKDATGNRRYWIMRCYEEEPKFDIFTDLTPDYINQVWAEAKTVYEKGVTLALTKEQEAEADKLRQSHLEESPYAGAVNKYLSMLVPEDWEKRDIADRRIYYSAYDESRIVRDSAGVWMSDENGAFVSHVKPIERVCPQMIWCEALEGNIKYLSKATTRELNDIIKQNSDWSECLIRSAIYGRQRGFKYCGTFYEHS